MYYKREILNNVKLSVQDKLLETCSVKVLTFDTRENVSLSQSKFGNQVVCLRKFVPTEHFFMDFS